MSLFTGSGVAIVTPFNENLEVNYEKFEEIIDYQIDNGTDSIVVCGTTGEASTLTDDEQLECIRFAVEKVKGRVPVIAGTGSNDTSHGIYLAKEANKLGVDGLLVVTPYYNKTSQKGLIEHYTDIAKSVDSPIILYNVPSRTGLNIQPKTAYELSKIENIVAIKEATGDISQVVELMHYCAGRLDLYSGNDDIIVPLLSLGGKGVISVVANIMPRETHDIVAKFMNGDIKGSADLQLTMLPIINAMFSDVNPIPVKEALNIIGFEVGACRKPLTSMDAQSRENLVNTIKSYGLSNI
ncbi:4-hydroxy-tetrahydrodipicolinate synthase [Natranaerovirga pectinivora]|uniref:4-hydroxy-tetrahydrodipicolinate synthase n=1 Tax=Natranaerovirga pectinivora TaxID=682400 RepID=A0A4R3MLR9_9FIRM|nr:4-hydroxy-tetrahydrodipicolinate synthase [Natranaerovirga pectinivora]TCT14637.1 4-hydroxy-tetrahydrodipicolinate synthase [Natranaerovirga pectinivora]